MLAIEEILCEAGKNGAGDVHLAAGMPPMMRVDGSLTAMNYAEMLPADTLDIVFGIMSEAQRQSFEERGEFDFALSLPGAGRFRVSAYKQCGSVALAFRPVGTEEFSYEGLGIPQAVTGLSRLESGLVLVTGPSGSGKSATLAAILDEINKSRAVHIITLEAPVEYLHSHKKSIVSQREIGSDSKSHAAALRAALRQDPDVILTDILRDQETVDLALAAAEAGCLVLSSMNTIDAAGTVERLIDLSLPHRQQRVRTQLADVLEAVVCQRLLPAASGGRVAAFEVLCANRAVRNLIREGKTQQLTSVMQTNKRAGMLTMDEALQQLCSDGKIDRETAVRNARDPETMTLKLM